MIAGQGVIPSHTWQCVHAEDLPLMLNVADKLGVGVGTCMIKITAGPTLIFTPLTPGTARDTQSDTAWCIDIYKSAPCHMPMSEKTDKHCRATKGSDSHSNCNSVMPSKQRDR
eukprot:1102631-Amphidinium_carterae.1